MKKKVHYFFWAGLFLVVQLAVWYGIKKTQLQSSFSCNSTVNRNFISKQYGAVTMNAEAVVIFTGNHTGSLKFSGSVSAKNIEYKFNHLMFYSYVSADQRAFYHVQMLNHSKNDFFSEPELPEGIKNLIVNRSMEKDIYGFRFINANTLIIGDGAFPLMICNRRD